jgi:hypothetical protein
MQAKAKCGSSFLLAAILAMGCACRSWSQQVTITSPAPGAVFAAGQMIDVSVSETGGPVLAVGVAAQGMGAGLTQTAPYSFSIPVPSGVIGTMNLVATGVVAPDVATISPVVTVDIEPVTPPTAIAYVQGGVTFHYVGQQRRIGIMATFADGSTEDVSNSTQLTWSSDTPSVVTVDSTGLITAQGPGTANVTATFGTQKAVLAVVGTTGVAGDLNGDGVVTQDDVAILESMLGSTPTVPNDGLDINGDGQINAADVTALLAICGSACSAPAPTTTMQSAPPAQIPFGQSLTLTAAVSNGSSTMPQGTVIFIVDGQRALTALLNSTAMASETLLSLTAGSHTIQAEYTGDPTDAPSMSSVATIQVAAPVMASIAVLPVNPSITLAATQQFTAYSVFSDGSVQNAIGAVWASQTASVATIDPSTGIATAVAPGTTQITATSGTMTSPPVTLTVTAAAAVSPTVTVSPSPSTITTAQSTMVAVTVSGGSGNPTPTGSVTLTGGSYASAATTLTSGSAVITVPGSALAIATNTLTATYTPDSASSSNYNSAMGTNSVTVTAAPSFALSNNGPINFEASASTGNTATISVAPGNGFTGAVNLTCAVTTAPANATSPATCGVTPSVTITGASSQNATLTVSTTTTTTAGAYAVTVTGASGAITMPTTVNVTVTAYIEPGFTLTNGGPITISSPGATTGNTTTITVMPSGGFTGNVTLTATLTSSPTGAMDPPTFSFGATSPVNITGASNGTGTLIVTTTTATTGALVRPNPRTVPWYTAGGATLACLIFFGIPARHRRWRSMLGMFTLLTFLAVGLVSCGGKSSSNSGSPGTTTGNYTITVTGASGSITQTTTITLTVN